LRREVGEVRLRRRRARTEQDRESMKTTTGLRLALAAALAGCADSAEPLQQPIPVPGVNPIDYPVSMWDRRVEGETMLLVHVTEQGGVDSAYVEKTSGHQAFDSAAVAGARQLQFTPGRRGEHVVSMWTRLPVRFALDSTATVGATEPPADGGQP
jgi:protein TonB